MENINEEDRCKRIADRRYDKPSAYKSGAIVRCRKGDIWKDLKEAFNQLLQEDESLHKWFKRSGPKGKEGGWVDCNAPDGNGGYKACGRKKGEDRSKYPACRPTPAGCKRKGKGKTWGKTKENMIKLIYILKQMLLEEKVKRDRCLRIADRKFDKPSAYKSGAVVRCRKGNIWKGIKEEELREIIKGIIQEDESLHKWFKRRGPKGKEGGWVDCNAPDGKGGYKSCGRKKGEKRSKYPSCRPTPAKCKSPGKGKKWGKTK
jgi:hypothetical protein